MTDLPTWDSLPQSVRSIPSIAARYLTVQPDGATLRVVGPTSTHIVQVQEQRLICDCIAAQNACVCKHAIAADRYRKANPVNNEADFTDYAPIRPSGGGNHVRPQYHRIPDGLYGGILSAYNAPKMVPGYNGGPEEMKIWLGFLVTHAINERPLDKPTQASYYPKHKWFYDPKTGKESQFFGLLHAMSRDLSKADVYEGAIPSLPKLVGQPVVLGIQNSENPDTNGVYRLRVVGVARATPSMRDAMRAYYGENKLTFGRDDRGHRFIETPKPATEEIAPRPSAMPDHLRRDAQRPPAIVVDDGDDSEDLPF